MPLLPNRPRYAARLNAFKTESGSVADMIGRAANVPGLDAADLNYPDHFERHDPKQLSDLLGGHGMALNGLAMRYYTNPAFKIGAFTNPDPAVRRDAVDLTKRGVDALAAMGGRLMTLWMGQDGFDYPFQIDYGRAWDETIAAIDEVAAHNRDVDIAIEYKPNEPRAYALMPDIGTTLLAVREVGAENLGVTLDFAHVLYADEMPAHAAVLVDRHSKLLGVHLNDGYGKRDDGLIAGSIHPVQTLELFMVLDRIGYDGVIYFDTFPDQGGLDPEREAGASLALVERLREIASGLPEEPELAAAMERQDAASSMRMIGRLLYGAKSG